MAYDATDPRAALEAAPKAKVTAVQGPAADAQYGLFYKEPPQEDDANGKTWYSRGSNFICAYSELKPGATFERSNQPDEYCVYLNDHDTPMIVEANGQTEQTDGYALAIIPPGQSKLTFPKGGRVSRFFTTKSKDLAEKCANARFYDQMPFNVSPLEPWPDPVGGYKIRIYSLDVPAEPGRLGRIFRCTTFMWNVPYTQMGPRDLSKLSPHHHDDFEQCSLIMAGTYTHHLRWPWTVDHAQWKEDEHAVVEAPSITVIPPPVIHTSVGGSAGENQLIDIFSPPRVDFSMRPGWVLNADEYPMPELQN